MARGDLTDQEWLVIGPLLPPERGRWARPAGDNRLFLNGMLHVLQHRPPLAGHACALRKVELGLCQVPALG
ncbi:transposase [Neokomagataea anthophila]|uniref:Transposase n=1 Tax=Neokomagataea anthophila TaxID=2826925 RepID=A0ABS5E9B8_9PROT|nr:transposase [Neokomagataea anthophila]MBR0560499.1 transposase [Neokomagataea anthophila]